MQEGTSSLMQMAKVAVAVEALHQAKLPFIAGDVWNVIVRLRYSAIRGKLREKESQNPVTFSPYRCLI